jgi:hypothetical protein
VNTPPEQEVRALAREIAAAGACELAGSFTSGVPDENPSGKRADRDDILGYPTSSRAHCKPFAVGTISLDTWSYCRDYGSHLPSRDRRNSSIHRRCRLRGTTTVPVSTPLLLREAGRTQ